MRYSGTPAELIQKICDYKIIIKKNKGHKRYLKFIQKSKVRFM